MKNYQSYNDYGDIVIKIKELRKSKKWTVRILAEKMLVSHVTISNWENGISEPDIKSMIKLAKLFDVSLDYLLDAETNNSFSFSDIKTGLRNLDRDKLLVVIEKQLDIISKYIK